MLQADLKQEGKGQYFIREIPGPQMTVNTTREPAVDHLMLATTPERQTSVYSHCSGSKGQRSHTADRG